MTSRPRRPSTSGAGRPSTSGPSRPWASGTGRSSLAWWSAVWLGWTGVGLFTVAQAYASAVLRDVTPDPQWSVWAPMLSVWLWVFFTPAVWALSLRYPVESRRLPAALSIHLLASLALAALDAGIDVWLLPVVLGVDLPSYGAYFASELWVNAFSYFALLAIVHAIEYRRLYKAEHETAETLSDRLAQAQLEALRAHLHPHFLFNAINGAAELLHESPDAADRMLTRLAGLLRRAFEESHERTVTLEEELSFSGDFLEITRLRFGDRLDFSISVEAEALGARVPGFLLQPILENAVRHGVEPVPGGARIHVEGRIVEDQTLVLTVADTGKGPSEKVRTDGHGHGLAMVRGLLKQSYGDRARLTLRPRDGGGTVAEIRMPARRAASVGIDLALVGESETG